MRLKLVAVLGLTIACLVWVLWGLDLHEVWVALHQHAPGADADCDGVDDDCDNSTDEDWDEVWCDTGLLGRCRAGDLRCQPNGQTRCAQRNQAGSEDCDNGQDDDCDGDVDGDDADC